MFYSQEYEFRYAFYRRSGEWPEVHGSAKVSGSMLTVAWMSRDGSIKSENADLDRFDSSFVKKTAIAMVAEKEGERVDGNWMAWTLTDSCFRYWLFRDYGRQNGGFLEACALGSPDYAKGHATLVKEMWEASGSYGDFIKAALADETLNSKVPFDGDPDDIRDYSQFVAELKSIMEHGKTQGEDVRRVDVQFVLDNWDGDCEFIDWYALDMYRDGKVTRQYVGYREAAMKYLNERFTHYCDPAGEPAEPGEFGDMPFYRVQLVDASEAKEYFEDCIAGHDGRWVTKAEAARILGVTPGRITGLVNSGKLETNRKGLVRYEGVMERKGNVPKRGRPRKDQR